jgi:hypothetical protein
VSRYAYALFFALMTGGVAAGVAGVLLGELTDDAGWAPAASGITGVVLAALVFLALLRASSKTRR